MTPLANVLFWWLAAQDPATLKLLGFRSIIDALPRRTRADAQEVVLALRELERDGLIRAGVYLEGVRDVEVIATDSQRDALRSVFVVHGHDSGLLAEVDALLQRVGLIPVVLQVRPTSGRTVIEMIEAYSDVQFAVCLLTPDDVGASARSPGQLRPRARQNVVLELGYFIGRLGRDRVHALHRGDVELPSDYHGVLFTSTDRPHNDWRVELCKELNAAGIPVDLSALL